jgi:dTDP-4-dehydrorhamnose 3,5-epimerase
MNESEILITGANGQLGKALVKKYPSAKALDSKDLDISNETEVNDFNWSDIKIIINAASYTNVDGAESDQGKIDARNANTNGVKNLAHICKDKDILLVHFSTDYVFNGKLESHLETEPFDPLNSYGISKAAGDEIASQVPKHYILRTSWVIGAGKNFVRTMLELGKRGISPKVVSDQIGRLTFTDQLVSAVEHLIMTKAEYGTYNLSNDGKPASWADVSRKIFELAGMDNIQVTDQSTADYFKDKPEAAKRPMNSTLDLTKIKATGFNPNDWLEDLKKYIDKEIRK